MEEHAAPRFQRRTWRYAFCFALLAGAALASAVYSLRADAGPAERLAAAALGFLAVRFLRTFRAEVGLGVLAVRASLCGAAGPLAAGVAAASILACVFFPPCLTSGASLSDAEEATMTDFQLAQAPLPGGGFAVGGAGSPVTALNSLAQVPLAWTEPVGPSGGRWVFFAGGEVREVGSAEWHRLKPRP